MMLKIVYTCCERINVTTDLVDSSRRMWQFSEGAALKESTLILETIIGTGSFRVVSNTLAIKTIHLDHHPAGVMES